MILVFKKTRDKKDKNHRITLKTHKRQSKLSQLRRDRKIIFSIICDDLKRETILRHTELGPIG